MHNRPQGDKLSECLMNLKQQPRTPAACSAKKKALQNCLTVSGLISSYGDTHSHPAEI